MNRQLRLGRRRSLVALGPQELQLATGLVKQPPSGAAETESSANKDVTPAVDKDAASPSALAAQHAAAPLQPAHAHHPHQHHAQPIAYPRGSEFGIPPTMIPPVHDERGARNFSFEMPANAILPARATLPQIDESSTLG